MDMNEHRGEWTSALGRDTLTVWEILCSYEASVSK